jgi:putative methyltransferase
VITNEVADREAAGHWAERLNMNVTDGQSLAALAREAGFLTVDISIHPRHRWLRLVATR